MAIALSCSLTGSLMESLTPTTGESMTSSLKVWFPMPQPWHWTFEASFIWWNPTTLVTVPSAWEASLVTSSYLLLQKLEDGLDPLSPP
ncbi:hypothetical protein V6N13_064328 [Hibiscus sabdariffa]|uniref:Uncharacterized protein n=1 Tax=Hibiscus sabdariffa TaxID=183260 RepID=A0ABR2E9Q4_9ROSI